MCGLVLKVRPDRRRKGIVWEGEIRREERK